MITVDLVAIGNRMRAARESLGLSRPAFVAKFDGLLTLRTLENNENGRNEAGIGLITLFAGLGVNAEWILTGEGEMFNAPQGSQATKAQADTHHLPNRLKEARARLGLTQKDVAEQVGVSARGYQGYEDGRNIPGGDAIAGLVRLGINANWLLTGKGGMFNADQAPQETTLSDYIALPLHNDAPAMYRDGAIVGDDEADDSLMFRKGWVKHDLQMQPEDLALIRVSGDSMYPTLRDGDVILVNQSPSQQDTDGICVMRVNGVLLVKRLQFLPGGQISVISDNATYKPWTLDTSKMAEGDVAIIGRVVWAGRRF